MRPSALYTTALCLACVSPAHSHNVEPHSHQTHHTHQSGQSIHGLLRTGLTFGGDDLIEVQFSGGDDDEVEAGGLLFLGAGFASEPGPSGLSYQFSFNYHVDSADASNGDADFSRWPLEALMFIGYDHRLGFGLSYHLNPKLDVDFDNVSGSVDFDDALGVVVEYNYVLQKQFLFGLRYTDIDYELENSSTEVDGSHVGVTFGLLF